MNGRSAINLALHFILASGLIVSACSRQERGSSVAGESDVYTLVSIDGTSIPGTISHGGVTMEVRSGRFVIRADGTCESRTVFVPPTGAEIAREVAATYTRDGAQLTMKWEGAGVTVGTVEGETFTMDNEGMIFVYER